LWFAAGIIVSAKIAENFVLKNRFVEARKVVFCVVRLKNKSFRFETRPPGAPELTS